MTYCSSLSFSVLTSKFMLVWPPVSPTECAVSSRSRVSLTRGRLGLRGLQLCDLLLDDRRSRVVGSELQEPLVGGDRLRDVAALLRGLGQLELDVRVPRRCCGKPVVRLLRLLEGGLGARVRLADGLVRLRRDSLLDRISSE